MSTTEYQKLPGGGLKTRLNGCNINFWDNIIQHCWAQHVIFVWTPCWDMLDRVGRSSTSVKLFVQHRPTFFFEHAHMRSFIGTQSIRVRQSECLPTLVRAQCYKNLLSLLLIHALVLPLFRLGSSPLCINLFKTLVATNFRFFHNWETAMFLFGKQIKN